MGYGIGADKLGVEGGREDGTVPWHRRYNS